MKFSQLRTLKGEGKKKFKQPLCAVVVLKNLAVSDDVATLGKAMLGKLILNKK